MGCDGGTIPRRDELVKTKKKPEQKDKDSERLYRWRHCTVSQQKLKSPIVACELGRLYNKEDVLTRLLEKAQEPAMDHIKSLKHIKSLTLTQNPSFSEQASLGDEYKPTQKSEYICPVTSQEMNGKTPFSFIWTCGCVVSEKALKEIKTTRCLVCNVPFLNEDVIPLNPTMEKVATLTTLMAERRAKEKAAKKSKKEGKRAAEDGVSSEQKKKKVATSTASTSKASAQKSAVISGVASTVLRTEEFDKMRSGKFTVASDPKKSEVYKSIFDTHKSAQGKTNAHWVTCNPQYF